MNKLTFLFVVILAISAALAWKGYQLYQAISPTPIVQWQHSDEESSAVINHQLWGDILNTYLFENNQIGVREFDYKAVTKTDKEKLNQYLVQLQSIDPRKYNRHEQMAYWANLYNALTIKLILKHYPLDSIKQIGDGITGPWNMEVASVANITLTLNQIEHGILRGLFKDKRIHYVINCASIGCPDLPQKPLSGRNIEQQLTIGAERFVNQAKGVSLNDGQLTLSSIYDWFSVDFGNSEQELIEHFIHHAQPELKEKLRHFNGEIDFDYNWKLNQPN